MHAFELCVEETYCIYSFRFFSIKIMWNAPKLTCVSLFFMLLYKYTTVFKSVLLLLDFCFFWFFNIRKYFFGKCHLAHMCDISLSYIFGLLCPKIYKFLHLLIFAKHLIFSNCRLDWLYQFTFPLVEYI